LRPTLQTSERYDLLIVQDFYGNEYKWCLTGHMPAEDAVTNRSSYHLKARNILRQLFGSQRLLEEVQLPGSQGLTLDFFLPSHMLGIEVQGEQHYEYNPYFHKTKWGFFRAQTADRRKRDWCELNEISLVEFPYYEDDEKWLNRLKPYTTGF